MSRNFSAYSEYYELIYADKDYEGEVEYLSNLIHKYHDSPKEILEIGMGTGTHASILLKNGFSIYGIEPSETMCQIARNKGLSCNVGLASTFETSMCFDVCLSLFHVVSYFTTNDEIINSFKNIYKHLSDKGIFIFDVWFTPAVINLKPETRVKRISSRDVEVIRIAESQMNIISNTVDVKFNVFSKKKNQWSEFSELHKMRYFSITEIQLFASLTGFETLLFEEWMTGNEPSLDSWGVTFVLKKI